MFNTFVMYNVHPIVLMLMDGLYGITSLGKVLRLCHPHAIGQREVKGRLKQNDILQRPW